MDIIIINVLRVLGISLFVLSLIAILVSSKMLVNMRKDGEIKGEDVKGYEAIRFYGIIIPSIAAIISLIILAPVIL